MAAAFATISLLLLVCVQGGAPVLGFTRSDFPEDFVFGAATSAYQVTDDPVRGSRTWIHGAFLCVVHRRQLFFSYFEMNCSCSMRVLLLRMVGAQAFGTPSLTQVRTSLVGWISATEKLKFWILVTVIHV